MSLKSFLLEHGCSFYICKSNLNRKKKQTGQRQNILFYSDSILKFLYLTLPFCIPTKDS